MNLKDRAWKEFVMGNIFNISSTASGIDKNKLTNKQGDIPYITRSDQNNGYSSFIGHHKHYKLDNKNVITIGLDTQTVFYQQSHFYTGQNIQVLDFDGLNKNVAKFIIPLLKKQLSKFNWGGNGATLTRLKKTKILLPVNVNNEPDYPFMDAFISQKERAKQHEFYKYIESRISKIKNIKKPSKLNEQNWAEFEIIQIADIISGKDIYEAERVEGNIPYVTATANNNGIGYFVGNNNLSMEDRCISVNRNGSIGYSFYHPYTALFLNDCRKLKLNNDNKYIGLFISRQITNQKNKYGYGYKMGTARLKKQKIMLPVNLDRTPNYRYMENYMEYLEYQKLIEYKSYLDKDFHAMNFNE